MKKPRNIASASALAALAGSLSLATATASPAPTLQPPPPLSLPTPTGAHAVGTVALWWVDPARLDPFAAWRERRQLMVQIWYPAERKAGSRPARYLAAKAARVLEGSAVPPGTIHRIATHAAVKAPVIAGRHPIVLFSPGYAVMRGLYTSLLVDLASRGFVVVALDHTYEAPVVQFPGGRLKLQRVQNTNRSFRRAFEVRLADVHFVLGRLEQLAARGARSRFAGRLDLSKIGMFGHSYGGAAAAGAMRSDARLKAGANLDGSFVGEVVEEGVRGPFLLMTSAPHDNAGDWSYRAYLSRRNSSQLALTLRGSGHMTFSDLVALGRPLAARTGTDVKQLGIGTIEPRRALQVQRDYLAAFFRRYLQGKRQPLLWTPSAAYPEIRFLR